MVAAAIEVEVAGEIVVAVVAVVVALAAELAVFAGAVAEGARGRSAASAGT